MSTRKVDAQEVSLWFSDEGVGCMAGTSLSVN